MAPMEKDSPSLITLHGTKSKVICRKDQVSSQPTTMFSILPVTDFSGTVKKYQTAYETTRNTYLAAAKNLKEETGPYKSSRDAYVAATATYTKSLYE